MNDLPGNPHAPRAIQSRNDAHRPTQCLEKQAKSAHIAQAEATLAVAYELRTANLIAMQGLGITDMSEWHPDHAAGWIERAKEIGERTGDTK